MFLANILMLILFFTFSANANLSAFSTDIDDVKKISIVYIESSHGLESSFGHIGLRLSKGLQTSFSDVSAEFMANSDSAGNELSYYIRGSGLYNPFPVNVILKNFEQFRSEKTLMENRRIEIVDLDLSVEQVQAFIKFIKNFNQAYNEYYFIHNNCAEIPLRFLEDLTGHQIEWSNIPNVAIENIRKLPFIASININESASIQRSQAVKSKLHEYEHIFVSSAEEKSFYKDLESPQFKDRMNAYMKLLFLFKKGFILKQDYKRIYSKLRNLEINEKKMNFRLLMDPEQADDIDIMKIVTPLPKRGLYQFSNSAIQVNANKVSLALSYTFKHDDRNIKSPKTKVIPISDLFYEKETNLLKYKNNIFGAKIQMESNEFILQNQIFTHTFIQELGRQISFINYIVIDKREILTDSKLIYKKKRTFKKINMLNSDKELNNGIGACLGFVILQKALTERAYLFQEYSNTLSPEEVLGLIKDLLAGKIVIFQGFNDYEELTSFVGREKLIKLLNEIQQKAQGTTFQMGWDPLFNKEELHVNTINDVLNMLKLGHSFPLEILYVDTSKGISDIEVLKYGHVIYVHHLEKIEEDKYEVHAYDPNFGTDHFYDLVLREDGKFKLTLSKIGNMFYPKAFKKFELWPRIHEQNPEEIQFYQAVRKFFNSHPMTNKNHSQSFTIDAIHTMTY